MARVSVVMPVLNGADLLPTAFASLEAQVADVGPFEVVVADNGSSDGTAEVARRHRGRLRVTVVDASERPGPAAAMNVGAAAATADQVFFMGVDDELSDGFLATVLADAAPRRIVAPRARPCSRRVPPVLYRYGAGDRIPVMEVRTPDGRRHGVPFVYNFFLIDRRAFLETGGFATDLLAGEDLDYCFVASVAGLEVVRSPAEYRYFLRTTVRGVAHTGRSSGLAGEAVRRRWRGRYEIPRSRHLRIAGAAWRAVVRSPSRDRLWRAVFLTARLEGAVEGRVRPGRMIRH
ncbi:MAG: glycosyltransferase family 2 protein [Microthrixaceae bacterium]